jgi:hypothetical protein
VDEWMNLYQQYWVNLSQRYSSGRIKILNLLGNGEQNTEERMVMVVGVGMFLLPTLQMWSLPVQEGQLFITAIEKVIFFMVLLAEIITVKIAL